MVLIYFSGKSGANCEEFFRLKGYRFLPEFNPMQRRNLLRLCIKKTKPARPKDQSRFRTFYRLNLSVLFFFPDRYISRIVAFAAGPEHKFGFKLKNDGTIFIDRYEVAVAGNFFFV